jgi:proteic killer suppression protein
VIKSFADRETEALFNHQVSRAFPRDIQRTALKRLRHLNAATRLQDLASPPGNRLEKLSGDRLGQYSIRINDQWRVCFTWNDGAENVEVVDYH